MNKNYFIYQNKQKKYNFVEVIALNKYYFWH